MEKQQEKNYKIVKSDINKWKELNGSLNQNCALALEIKANNENYYYYIEENGKIVVDFAIYYETTQEEAYQGPYKYLKIRIKL